ncbi:proteasome 26S subunit [Leucosporidium creatinivorum]|uniref:Proteasome 26S subunit n=1 Tax=Leucosporidium creatinivorum TaxID=106004 RepID=A0A1Y2G539_9BASI|nr:proteasome 26S subunit [Leucosporidium creatinivorum]
MATPNAEDTVAPIPNLQLAQHAFTLSQPALSNSHADARSALLAGIEQDEMAPYLSHLLTTSLLPSSSSDLLSKLKSTNESHLAKLDADLEDAKTNLGETEISDALKAKALYLARIGEKDAALTAHSEALAATAGLGSKIDLRLAMIRIGLFHGDHKVIQEGIDQAKILVEQGGDWDRRNRLKAYEGLYLLSIRNFQTGSQLLLDTLSTFTATELIEYDEFVKLVVISGTLTLERKELKKKIIEAPEVIALLPTVPTLANLSSSLWKCDYRAFFLALADLESHHLHPSRLLSQHTRYFIREMRIKAYAQLLESYSSVTLKSLSEAFGVGEGWLDGDLASFIALSRLNASIDRVAGIVTTNRPDSKNARYAAVIKQGDVVLTSVQRLSRVVG